MKKNKKWLLLIIPIILLTGCTQNIEKNKVDIVHETIADISLSENSSETTIPVDTIEKNTSVLKEEPDIYEELNLVAAGDNLSRKRWEHI